MIVLAVTDAIGSKHTPSLGPDLKGLGGKGQLAVRGGEDEVREKELTVATYFCLELVGVTCKSQFQQA